MTRMDGPMHPVESSPDLTEVHASKKIIV
jgi:hypothetical protein